MEDTAYERVLCVKNEVLVYRIPPRPSNRGYRADDWKLDAPDWTGRLRVVSKGKDLFIKLEDRNSGELFAQCPVDAHPGIAVEPVMDSSRYFVLRIKDDTGRSAFIGIGFHDRSDSFDLNVSLQDHFKWLRQEAEEAKNANAFDHGPKLDLGFKEGQTITLNLGTKKDGKARAKPVAKTGNIGLLPPPPGSGGGIKIAAPAAAPSQLSAPSQPSAPSHQENNSAQAQASPSSNVQNVDLLLGLGSSAPSTNTASTVSQNPPDLWGDFTGAAAGSQNMTSASSDTNSNNAWIQF